MPQSVKLHNKFFGGRMECGHYWSECRRRRFNDKPAAIGLSLCTSASASRHPCSSSCFSLQHQYTYTTCTGCAGLAQFVTRSSADADNRLDAFSGQSNMVPFHMLHIVSYCAIVTLSLRYSSSKNFMTLKWGSKVTQGH